MKYKTICTFKNVVAAQKMAGAYRKQFGLGLDGKPRSGRKARRAVQRVVRRKGKVNW